MAKPRVFISSTFYDLRQVRADMDMFIESLGYEPVRNEEGDIPYGNDDRLEEYCYKEIKGIDILISIIGGRFGSESKNSNKSSISQVELRTAHKEKKQIYIFIEKNVLAEYETYLLNKESDNIKFRYVDDIRIYKFIEEIKGLNTNNNIKGFETASDITRYLKEQLAGLFQSFLEERTRIKEISIINNLEKTAETLNKLVNYLSDENKGQAEEINKILTINHPLVEEIRTHLGIQYNFYIEGIDDMSKLLEARGFAKVEVADDNFIYWKNKEIQIKISSSLFESDNKLKFIRHSDWDNSLFEYQKEEEFFPLDMDDELPF